MTNLETAKLAFREISFIFIDVMLFVRLHDDQFHHAQSRFYAKAASRRYHILICPYTLTFYIQHCKQYIFFFGCQAFFFLIITSNQKCNILFKKKKKVNLR